MPARPPRPPPPAIKPQPVPVDEPLATLDRYTYEGLITGRVTLPGRSVHVGVWFRLLRSLLDEPPLTLTTRTSPARPTFEPTPQPPPRPPPPARPPSHPPAH